MSATIPETALMSDLLKPTGFDCPAKLQGKTFAESTAGDTPVVLEDNKEVSITSNGTIEITPTAGHDYAGMKKVTASVSVAGADIEANKAATIDVSAYTEPVEITPTAGKEGMAKATVTLSNIPSPSGGSGIGYHWTDTVQNRDWWFSFGTSPTDKTAFEDSKYMAFTVNDALVRAIFTPSCDGFFGPGASYTLTKVSDTKFILTYEGQDITFTRDSSKDFTLWR